MNREAWDYLCEENLPDIPPEDVVRGVTPWRRAIRRVLVGLVLTTFTFRILKLNYILPLVGGLLLLMGFRTLRRENRWFGACYVMAVVLLGYDIVVAISQATIYHRALMEQFSNWLLPGLSQYLMWILYFCLWQGIQAVQAKVDYKPKSDYALYLLLWYTALLCIGTYGWEGEILILLLLGSYYAILRNMFRLPQQIEETGYGIRTAPLRISNNVLVSVIMGITVAGIAAGYIFCHSYPMEWSPWEQTQTAEVVKIKEELKELGFPAHVLEDMSEDAILSCAGANHVVTKLEIYSGKEIRGEAWDIYRTDEEKAEDEEPALRMTGIAVCVEEDMTRWQIIEHFEWEIDPGFYGTEALQIRPEWYSSVDPVLFHRPITGQVLYDQADEIYVADYYSQEEIGTLLNDTPNAGSYFAAFSFPKAAENARGYVTYELEHVVPHVKIPNINHQILYLHQTTWAQYPVEDTVSRRCLGIAEDEETIIWMVQYMNFWGGDVK